MAFAGFWLRLRRLAATHQNVGGVLTQMIRACFFDGLR
jgi:hypothetical protein